jgi:hypothetical protein
MRKLRPHKVDWAQIDRFLASAEKKLAAADKILAFDEEACLQQAYEAMLKGSLGFMFSHGFRARSHVGHRIAIIEFVRTHIDRKHAALLTLFDRLCGGSGICRSMTIQDSFRTTMPKRLCKPPATTWQSFAPTSMREDLDVDE